MWWRRRRASGRRVQRSKKLGEVLDLYRLREKDSWLVLVNFPTFGWVGGRAQVLAQAQALGGGLVCALGPYVFSALGLVYLVPALLAPPPPVQSSLVTAAVTQVKQPGLFSACPLTRASQTESGNKIVGELVRARFRRPRERIEWCKKKQKKKHCPSTSKVLSLEILGRWAGLLRISSLPSPLPRSRPDC